MILTPFGEVKFSDEIGEIEQGRSVVTPQPKAIVEEFEETKIIVGHSDAGMPFFGVHPI